MRRRHATAAGAGRKIGERGVALSMVWFGTNGENKVRVHDLILWSTVI